VYLGTLIEAKYKTSSTADEDTLYAIQDRRVLKGLIMRIVYGATV
jgi:hypothetical protein